MKKLLQLSLAAVSAALALALTGCDSDKDRSTDTGPADGAAFEGAVISFNPTVTFTSSTTFRWENESGDVESLLITDVGTPLEGTFTYVPSADFTTGTLNFTFDDPEVAAKQLNLSNFNGTVNGIRSFTISIDSVTYEGTVLNSGSALLPQITINAPGDGDTGGGGSIANGTDYSVSIGEAEERPGATANGTPPSLPTGAATLRIANDRASVSIGGTVYPAQGNVVAPGLGGAVLYVVTSNSGANVTLRTISITYNTSDAPVGGLYSATLTEIANTKIIDQEITFP